MDVTTRTVITLHMGEGAYRTNSNLVHGQLCGSGASVLNAPLMSYRARLGS